MLLDDGIYRAYILLSREAVSKPGNKMRVIWCEIFADDYERHIVADYLPYVKNMEWKYRHLFDSAGRRDEWEEWGFIARAGYNEMKGWNVVVSIVTDNKQKPPANIIKDYIKKADQ